MKSFFILSFILSFISDLHSTGSLPIFDLPLQHFDVAHGTPPPTHDLGHFHTLVEVKITRITDAQYWIENDVRQDIFASKIRQGFVQPVGTFYIEDENPDGKLLLVVTSFSLCLTPSADGSNKVALIVNSEIVHSVEQFGL